MTKKRELEKRSELVEAKLEELVWEEAYNDDNDTLNTNEKKALLRNKVFSSRRSNVVINGDLDTKKISSTKATQRLIQKKSISLQTTCTVQHQ